MKRILLLIFFVSVLKVSAQGKVEMSFGGGPTILTMENSYEDGASFKGTLGYRFKNGFTILAGFEYVSLNMESESVDLSRYTDTTYKWGGPLGNAYIRDRRVAILGFNAGIKFPFIRTGDIHPYFTAGFGSFSINKSDLVVENYNYNLGDLVISGLPPLQVFASLGVDFDISDDNAVYLEVGRSIFAHELEGTYTTTPIQAGLRMWF